MFQCAGLQGRCPASPARLSERSLGAGQSNQQHLCCLAIKAFCRPLFSWSKCMSSIGGTQRVQLENILCDVFYSYNRLQQACNEHDTIACTCTAECCAWIGACAPPKRPLDEMEAIRGAVCDGIQHYKLAWGMLLCFPQQRVATESLQRRLL